MLKRKEFLVISLLLVAMLLLMAGCSTSNNTYSSSKSKTQTCKVCHRTFEKGSKDYDSIFWNNMCTNCYDNYRYAMELRK